MIALLKQAPLTGSEREIERRRLEVLQLLFPGDTLPHTPQKFWAEMAAGPAGRPKGRRDSRPRKRKAQAGAEVTPDET